MVASRECQMKGILVIPFLFKIGIAAAENRNKKVIIPLYIISGLPKIGKKIISLIIFLYYSTIILPVIEGCIEQE